MKFKNSMIVVCNMEKSQMFYRNILGLRTIMDFGANVTLTGGLSLQTKESWKEFVHKDDNEIQFGGNNFELYFEEDDYDKFLEKLSLMEEIQYVHPVFEHKWGQRVVRFYDPDKHIIEVSENMKIVCKRFIDTGMTVDEVAQRMDVPVKFVTGCIS